jgi:hypothetical protein
VLVALVGLLAEGFDELADVVGTAGAVDATGVVIFSVVGLSNVIASIKAISNGKAGCQLLRVSVAAWLKA